MTKKDFIELADIIRCSEWALQPDVIFALADFCQKRNPRFDRDKWLTYIEKEDK